VGEVRERTTTMSGTKPNEDQEKPAEDVLGKDDLLIKEDALVRSTSEAESVMSFESDDLEDVYEKAPHDLFHESPKLGKILVLKEGEKVPTMTKYMKTKKGGLTAIRFRFCSCSL
jgi:hypothetical protein